MMAADPTPLVPLDIAIKHLRVDPGAEDDLIKVYLGAAIKSALNYINRQVYATEDDMAAAVLAETAGADPILIEDDIKAAILLILGRLYENRSETVIGLTVFDIPTGSKQLLFPYRIGLGV